MVILHTTFGKIKIELDFKNAPKTAENFINYATSGFYDGTLFHRVIDNFMIQGGGLLSDMSVKKTNSPIENEAENGLANEPGTVAMARTSDPHSATSQFFINVADNKFLNFTSKSGNGWGYCVFGKVVEGMEVVNKIKSVETTRKAGHQDVPVDDVLIERVEVVETEVENV